MAEGGIRALPYFGFGKLKLHTSILIEHHAAGRAFKRNGPNGGIVPENGHAYAAANIARVVRKFLQLAVVIDILHALFDALIKAVEIILVFGKIVLVPNLHQVHLPEPERGNIEPPCNIVHMAFHCKHHLRNAVAAHRAGGSYVCVNGIGVPLAGAAVTIKLPERARALCANAVAVACIRALV